MTVEPADSDTTMLIKRVEAPPPGPTGTLPPPPPPGAVPGAQAQAPVVQPALPPGATGPGAPPPPPQTMADAMRAVSMPPLAATVAPQSVGTFDAAPAVPTAAFATPAPPTTTTAVAMPPPDTEIITCPECGTTARVTLNRRDSVDFCRTCDYPLFWTPSKVIRDPSDSTDESLRRLPGTVGRATIAALPCPFCSEPNALSAQTCVRCHRPMHPVEEPPPPQPVYVAPPPAPVEEPPAKVSWWVWALLAFGAAALITLIVLIATHTIG